MAINHPYQHLSKILDQVKAPYLEALRLEEAERYLDAINAYQSYLALAGSEAVQLPLGLVADVYMQIGACYARSDDWSEALIHYAQAERLLKEDRLYITDISEYNNITIISVPGDDLTGRLARLYDAVGTGYAERAMWEEADLYYEKSLQHSQEQQDTKAIFNVYEHLIHAHQMRCDWDGVIKIARVMLGICENTRQEIIVRRYIAQAYDRLGQQTDVIAELEWLVLRAEADGYHEVADDKRMLRRLSGGEGQLWWRKLSPAEILERYPLDELFESITVHLEKRVMRPSLVTFVIHTCQFELAAWMLSCFQLSVVPINLALIRQLSVVKRNTVPAYDTLLFDWYLSDIHTKPVYRQVIPEDMIRDLKHVNEKTRSFMVILEGSCDGHTISRPIPGLYEGYMLDWVGTLGVVRILRETKAAHRGSGYINKLLSNLQHQFRQTGFFSGMYNELGLLYAMQDNLQLAIQHYRQEIKFNMIKEELPGKGAIEALNNLGDVYKQVGDYKRASLCYMVALGINPNYFQALLDLSFVTVDQKATIALLSHAYRLRSADDPVLQAYIQYAAETYQLPLHELEQTVCDLSRHFIDLEQHYSVKREYLEELGF